MGLLIGLYLVTPARGVADGIPRAKTSSKQLALAQKACDRDDAAACHRVGQVYLDENGMRAREAFEKACRLGSLLGCTDLGWTFATFHGRRDMQRAEQLFKKSCDAGELSACAMLGDLYASDDGALAQNLPAARELYERTCNGKNDGLRCGSGCEVLARWSHYGEDKLGIVEDHAKAARLEERSCKAGCISSCSDLADYYRDGDGVAIDAGAAAKLYQHSCDERHATSCKELGKLYLAGSGVKANTSRAMKLFDRACQLSKGRMDGCKGDASGKMLRRLLASCDRPAESSVWVCNDILGFRKWGSVGGTVRFDGKPVPGVRVVIDTPDEAVAMTDANGAFVQTDVPAGRFTVRVLPSLGRNELARTTVTIIAGKQTPLAIDLEVRP